MSSALSASAVEEWLGANSDGSRSIRKPEFLEFFSAWREVFEPLIKSYRPTATDVTAIQRVDSLDSSRAGAAGGCGLSLLFGAFCALWAQNTRRSPILWFLLGAIFSVITVLVLLYKNSHDLARGNLPPRVIGSCPKCGRDRTAGQLMCDCGHYLAADR
ncbi:MAG TPA: hypothetical protein VFS60_12390 [Thermoanaerobaculia bacterium]|nr:hypothetical protein [Thermoanaerobaculia bacterium]